MKNLKKAYLEKCLECAALKRWLKYTTTEIWERCSEVTCFQERVFPIKLN